MTRVFSTNRGVREFYANFSQHNLLIPKAITISEFESRAVVIKDRAFIDSDSRFFLLKDAVDFSKFDKLQFNSEFFTFLKHSSYIFKFFDEIASEDVDIDDLSSHDTYALYDEHLDILETTRQRYIDLLDKNSFVDKINLSKLYTINEDYLKNLESIEIKIDGFLSRYEMELFEKCSKIVPFYVIFEINEYNQKTKSAFVKYGFELLDNHTYKLDFTNKKILSSSPNQEKKLKADIELFNTRLSQIGFIFSKISEFIEDGIRAEDIVVVLPDESIAPVLKEFDRYKNLNFAMGFSLSNSKFYKRIEAIELAQNRRKDEQKMRVKRLEIPEKLMQIIQKEWKKEGTQSLEILNEILLLDEKESEQEIFKEELYKFSKFLSKLGSLSLEQAFRLFLSRLKSKSMDDIGGGKITVMGILETRGSRYEGVIVPDFSDDFVPRRSQKDLFLNTSIRKSVGLPTKKDRENLQKFYYHQLFTNAKKVAICSTANETTMPSRFLDSLSLRYDIQNRETIYNSILFDKKMSYTPAVLDIKGVSYRLDGSKLSATKLDTLLTCRRKFYFKYIKKLEEPKNILTNSNATIGLKLHDVLESVLKKSKRVDSADKLLQEIKERIKDEIVNDIEEFNQDMWIKKLENFVQNEAKREKEGYEIYDTETWLECDFSGFRICGKLDRVDIKDDKLHVIDYKSGDTDKLFKQKLENMTNFQLEFYYILASTIREVQSASYYDLRSGKLIQELLLQEKIDKLKDTLKIFKEPITTYELCEKQSNCIYCPYKKLCLRQD